MSWMENQLSKQTTCNIRVQNGEYNTRTVEVVEVCEEWISLAHNWDLLKVVVNSVMKLLVL